MNILAALVETRDKNIIIIIIYGRGKAVEWAWMPVFGLHIHMCIYSLLWAIYTFIALLIGANNCEDNCVCMCRQQ